MPLRRLFVGVGGFEEGFLTKGLADNLHAYGQAVGETGGDGNTRETGNIYGQSADVTEIHLKRVVHPLANLKGDGGGGRGD